MESENKNIRIDAVEIFEHIENKYPNVRLTAGTRGRYYIHVSGFSYGFMSIRNYGLGWYNKWGGYKKTLRVTSYEQLTDIIEKIIDGKPVDTVSKKQTPTINVDEAFEPIPEDDKELIPEQFNYYTRPLAGRNDLEVFEILMYGNKNVCLEGPTGSGKTTLPRYFAYKHQLPYRRVSLNGGTTPEDLIGHYTLVDGKTLWVDGILTQAVKRGWILVIDEPNFAPPEVLSVLNALTDDEGILVLAQKEGEVIKPHPNFRLITTMNPSEEGYAGTNEMNESLLDRFDVTLYIGYNHQVEKNILKEMKIKSNDITKILNFTQKIREAYKEKEILTPFSTRQMMSFASLFKNGMHELIIGRFKESDKNTVRDCIRMYF